MCLSTTIPQEEKFLFVISTRKIAVTCCCGCTLKAGIIILMILYLLTIINDILSDQPSWQLAISIIFSLARLVATVCIIISLKNLQYYYASLGYVILTLLFFLGIIYMFVIIGMMLNNPGNVIPNCNGTIKCDSSIIIIMVFIFLTNIMVEVYLLWVIFSYTKLLKYQMVNTIEGQPEQNHPNNSRDTDFNYQINGQGSILV